MPYSESIAPKAGGILGRFFGAGQVSQLTQRAQNFDNHRKLLDDRVSSISSNLASIGLRVVRLNTEQLIELLYNSYNFSAGPQIDASQLENITITKDNKS